MATQIPHTNWQSLGAGGMYGGATAYGGGGTPVARDTLDSLRMGVGRTPEAQYPDGYLGTIHVRRDDRLLDSLKSRQAERSYQRGIHKGERIDPSDYFWPKGLDPMRGLRNEARGKQTGPEVYRTPAPHLADRGKINLEYRAFGPGDNQRKTLQLQYLRPGWR